MTSWAVPGYTEVGELGRGATGRVVEATSDDSGARVAIKYLDRSLLRDSAFLDRFREEARLLTQLDVPQVVRFYEYVEQPGQGAAIVMELVNGRSLHELISRRVATSPESAFVVLKGSLLGLAAAHAIGVVHRDYKPENVLLDISGASKLSDFGVAVQAGRSAPAAGTPLYMAPEQWAGAPAAPASDIYAATAVFFECLTGRTPFSGRIRQLRQQHEHSPVPTAEVDEPLRGLVERGMAKDPAARPPDAGAFLVELEDVAAAYGEDWEERGRSQLAERVAALALLLVRTGVTGGTAETTTAVTFLSRHRVPVLAVTAAVVVAATAVGTAIAVAGKPTHGGHHRKNPIVVVAPPTKGAGHAAALQLSASAHVAPTAQTIGCGVGAPSFGFDGTITASSATTVTYHWALPDGTSSTARTLTFTGAGTQAVGPDTFTPPADRYSGSAAIVITSPQSKSSNRAAFTLSCTNPNISLTLSSSPPSPDNILCGTAVPTFTITAGITSGQATQVTYHWVRSDGSATSVATISVGAGQTEDVTDTLTPPAATYTGSDTIDITAPVAVSQSLPISVSCTASHVSSVTVSNVQLDLANCSKAGAPGSFTVVVDASNTGPVTLSWAMSENSSPSPGPPAGSGSQVLSGQTTYTVMLSGSFGPTNSGGYCFAGTDYVAQATATGTDNVPASNSSYYLFND